MNIHRPSLKAQARQAIYADIAAQGADNGEAEA